MASNHVCRMHFSSGARAPFWKCVGALGMLAGVAGCLHHVSTDGPTDVAQLEREYRNFWFAAPKFGDDLDRELFQLAFPETNEVAIWHLYQKGAKTPVPTNAYRIQACPRTRLPPLPPTSACVEDVTSTISIRTIDAVASGAIPRAERITFAGLEPDRTYRITITPPEKPPVLLRATTAPLQTHDKTSFLAFSCNNPYGITEDNTAQTFAPRSWRENMARRQNSLRLFEERAQDRIRLEGRFPPSFTIGLGDQVYVDGDNGAGNRIAMFTGNRSQLHLTRPVNYDAALDVVYRAHFAMTPFHRALQGTPAAFIWDDHELQDGWGTGINPWPSCTEEEAYFGSALRAFLDFQSLRNPKPSAMHNRDGAPMDVDFKWGDRIHVLMLDTRSSTQPTRQTPGQDVQWKGQLERVDKWLDGPEKEQPMLFVLGLPSPLTIASAQKDSARYQKFMTWIAKRAAQGEPEDDLEDLWAMKPTAREDLLIRLTNHFMRHRKHRLLILSGDVHFSGISYLSTGTGSCWHRKDATSCWAKANVDKSDTDFVSFDKRKQDAIRKTMPDNERDTCTEGDDVLWGWEVITSGITNDAYPGSGKRLGLRQGTISAGDPKIGYKPKLKPNEEDSLVTAYPRGTIYGSPSFAEITVDKNGDELNVGVLFYPSAFTSSDGKQDRAVNDVAWFEAHAEQTGAWKTEDYQSYAGSEKGNICVRACPNDEQLTRVPLNWSCIPNKQTWFNAYNCVHACSVIFDKQATDGHARHTKSQPARED